MHDVDRIVRKLRSQLCPTLQTTNSMFVRKDNLGIQLVYCQSKTCDKHRGYNISANVYCI